MSPHILGVIIYFIIAAIIGVIFLVLNNNHKWFTKTDIRDDDDLFCVFLALMILTIWPVILITLVVYAICKGIAKALPDNRNTPTTE